MKREITKREKGIRLKKTSTAQYRYSPASDTQPFPKQPSAQFQVTPAVYIWGMAFSAMEYPF